MKNEWYLNLHFPSATQVASGASKAALKILSPLKFQIVIGKD
jgi:hypothetical protein